MARRLMGGAADGNGTALMVEGPAGIGKTRLLQAIAETARRDGLHVLFARGDELEQSMSFAVVQQLLERRVSDLPADVRRTMLGGAAEHALAALQIPGEADPLGGAAADTSAVLHGLYWLLAGLAERRPHALVIDDAHWSDPQSLEFLCYLAKRLNELRLLLVVGTRSAGPDSTNEPLLERLRGQPEVTVLTLAPLSAGAVREVLDERFGEDAADAEFAARCHEVTGGNPFLVTQVIRELDARGIAPSGAAVDELESMASDDLSQAVIARVRDLSPEAAEVAEAVAILGEDATEHATAELAGLRAPVALACIDELVQAELLAALRPLRFVHPLVRAAVSQAIPDGRRALAHKRAARLLAAAGAPTPRVAAHLLASGRVGDPWVVDVLRRAATRSLAAGALEPAVDYLTRALEEPPSQGCVVEVLHELGRTEAAAGRPAGASHLLAALDATDSPVRRAEIAFDLSRAVLHTPTAEVGPHEIIDVLDRALSDLGPADRELAMQLEAKLLLHSQHVRAPGWKTRARRAPRDLPGETRGERLLLTAVVSADLELGQATAATVADRARRALTDGDLLDPRQQVLTGLRMVGCLTVAGAFHDAEYALRRAQDACRHAGWENGFAQVSAQLAFILMAGRGALVEAETEARTAYDISTQFAPQLAAALLERGQLDNAAAVLDDAARCEPARRWAEGPLAQVRGRLLLASGQTAAGIDQLSRLGDGPDFYNWRLDLAVALSQTGRTGEARAIIADKLRRARDFGSDVAVARALHAQALAEGEPGQMAALREAAGLLEHSGSDLPHAQVLASLGRALRRADERPEARRHLYRALELARRCGADGLAARVEAELRSAGGRPPRHQRTPADALSPSERKVARLAADGLSNRQIAQALFVTLKAVEKHLTSAYRKLGVTSRAELRQLLEPGTDDLLR